MTLAIRMHQPGGPEVLQLEEISIGAPGPGEVRLRHEAIGVNFIDTYHRSGLYPLAMPITPGVEGAGRVEAIGPGVTEFKVGDRVAYGGSAPGSYSVERLVAADRLVKLPDTIDTTIAAATLMKGMTAEYLLRRTYPVKHGDFVLFHAAAGGTGLLACQWAAHLGAIVIGTVSTPEKAAIARAHGCAHVVVTKEEDFVARVKAVTGGRGCEVVYDGVGRDTFTRSLECLAPRGVVALFGQSSGTVGPIDPAVLAKGSYYLTRPTLFTYNARREDLVASAAALFDVIASGGIRVEPPRTYRLAEAAQAHRDLEARKTTGSVVLLP